MSFVDWLYQYFEKITKDWFETSQNNTKRNTEFKYTYDFAVGIRTSIYDQHNKKLHSNNARL